MFEGCGGGMWEGGGQCGMSNYLIQMFSVRLLHTDGMHDMVRRCQCERDHPFEIGHACPFEIGAGLPTLVSIS